MKWKKKNNIIRNIVGGMKKFRFPFFAAFVGKWNMEQYFFFVFDMLSFPMILRYHFSFKKSRSFGIFFLFFVCLLDFLVLDMIHARKERKNKEHKTKKKSPVHCDEFFRT